MSPLKFLSRFICIISFSFGIFYTSNLIATNCTYCYQIASVEITFRNKKTQQGYISWSPNQDFELTERGFLDDAKKKQRIRFFKQLSKGTSDLENDAVSEYYALAKNVLLLRRYDIKRIRILNANYGSARSDIQIVRR
ncbi:MAG: hypothetical protein IPL26_23185 [Leptospiraceae bacterium]|nr:hypothetical protein [Leptospiraceae bacterium]